VESRVGQGSTFNFTIRARPTELPPPTYMGSSQPHLSGKRLLIVDDNPTNRQILEAQTRGWGMISIQAASGAEALELLRQAEGQPFDLAILDMAMPEMDGLMLAENRKPNASKPPSCPRTWRWSCSPLGRLGSDPRLREFSAFRANRLGLHPYNTTTFSASASPASPP
jgi:hypothetical protein